LPFFAGSRKIPRDPSSWNVWTYFLSDYGTDHHVI